MMRASRASAHDGTPLPEDRIETLGELLNKLEAMPEQQRLREFERFNYSRKLLARNYECLLAEINRLTGPEDIDYQAMVNRWKLDFLLEEVVRQLHNFVTSANTLVDHSRRIYEKLYRPARAFAEYESEVKRRFVDDQQVQFLHGLRNMCLHYRLPSVGTRTAWERDESKGGGILTITFELEKKDLEAFSNWNAAAKEYLATQPERIDLRKVIEEYFHRVMAFHSWMQEQQIRLHRSDVDQVAAVKQSLLPQILPQLRHAVESSVMLMEKEGVGDLKAIFAITLNTDEQMQLDVTFGRETEWIERALEIVSPRLGLGKELIEKIRRVI